MFQERLKGRCSLDALPAPSACEPSEPALAYTLFLANNFLVLLRQILVLLLLEELGMCLYI